MKKIIKITGSILPMVIFLATYSCKDAKSSQEVSEPNDQSEITKEPTSDSGEVLADAIEFNEKNTQESYKHYNHIRTALVNGDEVDVKLGAEKLMESTDDEALRATLKNIIGTSDISAQREAFATVNQQMEMHFKQNISSGTLYKQFCPMALNNKGAFWFSEIKEIRNPYFGDQMLKCGEVVETIN